MSQYEVAQINQDLTGTSHFDMRKSSYSKKASTNIQRILIVEDELSLKTVLEYIIRSVDKNIEIHWAVTAEKAMLYLNKYDYDFVLTDHYLEGSLTGLVVWKYTRKHYPQLPIAMMSSLKVHEFLRLTKHLKETPAFLPKPFSYEEFKSFVNSRINNNKEDL